MHKVLLLGGVWLALWTYGGLHYQVQNKPAYKPNEVHALQLQVAQKDAQLAQLNYRLAQENLQNALTNYTQVAEKIKKEEGWPSEVTFDPNTGTFTVEAKKP